MRGNLLHSLSKLCVRNQSAHVFGAQIGCAAWEPVAVQLSNLASCFGTCDPTFLARSSLHTHCNQPAERLSQAHLTWLGRQLTDMKVS